MSDGNGMKENFDVLTDAIVRAAKVVKNRGDDASEAQSLHDLGYRLQKLRRAWRRPQCLGFFGPSQAGKSFLVGALLSHELGTLKVISRTREIDFLAEINPAKGVESTGTVTRFSSGKAPTQLEKGDFYCSLLDLEVVLESMATGFLVECTSPVADPERVERVLSQARRLPGPEAPARYRKAWEAVWHNLLKKYQSRHAYLNELKENDALRRGDFKDSVKTIPGWLMVYSLLWGGSGYAKDLDRLMELLEDGLRRVEHREAVEVDLAHVQASSDGASLIDAACLNSVGTNQGEVTVYPQGAGGSVSMDPGVLSALIAEIRLQLPKVDGSLLDGTDMLDFPGGRALKGINGFGHDELNSGNLDNAIEVYKRGKLTFLFERYAIEREITALVLCSPGPTKPEAIQLQTQVERWLQIRYGRPTPSDPDEIARPSLFMALTKFDMSLGALRSDNAKDRWDSRVGEACVDFWARNASSWVDNWGGKNQAFDNMFWVCNPYADQMRALGPGDAGYEEIKAGYLASRSVQRYIADPDDKWQALEGKDDAGLPKSGIPLLASALRSKLAEDIKARELRIEAAALHHELTGVLRALTPSRDEAELRMRLEEDAKDLIEAVNRAMMSEYSGAVFGRFVDHLVMPVDEVEHELRKVWNLVAPMSIKLSDKIKKILVHMLKWWSRSASRRFRDSSVELPLSNVERFVREVCTSKKIMSVLGKAIFPYFSRKEIDFALVASIMQVKISDALLGLFSPSARRKPDLPARLSYAEALDAGPESSAEVDWGDVDFEEDLDDLSAAAEDVGSGEVEIIFAGNRYYRHWVQNLAPFYVASGGGKLAATMDDPATRDLIDALKRLDGVAFEAR